MSQHTKLIGHSTRHGVTCNEWKLQKADPDTGALINKTIWVNSANGAPVCAYYEYPRMTPKGSIAAMRVWQNWTGWQSGPQPDSAFALPKSCNFDVAAPEPATTPSPTQTTAVCETIDDRDKCDAASGCTFCTGGWAYMHGCYSKSAASRLPPHMFTCDHRGAHVAFTASRTEATTAGAMASPEPKCQHQLTNIALRAPHACNGLEMRTCPTVLRNGSHGWHATLTDGHANVSALGEAWVKLDDAKTASVVAILWTYSINYNATGGITQDCSCEISRNPTATCPVAAGWCEVADSVEMLESPKGHASFVGFALTTDGKPTRVNATNGTHLGFLRTPVAVSAAMDAMVKSRPELKAGCA